MPNIRVAVVGVGNCCSAFVQGISYYGGERKSLGLRHPRIGNYRASDVKIVAAFDVDEGKVGRDLSEAIFVGPNAAMKFAHVPKLGTIVLRGPLLDGVPLALRDAVRIGKSIPVNVAEELIDAGADMVLNLLPAGAIRATHWYAKQAMEAGCAFINATPTPIASDGQWADRFKEADLAVAGDDLMDQMGATVLHKAILSIFRDRGVHVDGTYQLDVGGSIESRGTLLRAKRLKRRIKTACVARDLPYKTPIVAGTTDYVPFLGTRRDNFLWVEGTYFGGAKIRVDVFFNAMDAENAGSVLMDVVRGTKIAIDRGLTGPLRSVSAYGFKLPPVPASLSEADQWFTEFVEGKRNI